MATSTVTSKGQITLPKALRDDLKLKTGDRVDFVKEPDGGYRVRPANRDVRELFGCLKHLYKGPPLSVEEMDQAIGDHLVEKYTPRKRGR
jgi:antitoxin PrlF